MNLNSKIKCEICGKEFNRITDGNFPRHIKKHNISLEEYYIKYIDSSEHNCPVCGKHLPFINLSQGYKKHCNIQCANKDPEIKERVNNTKKNRTKEQKRKSREKYENTPLERYGTKDYGQFGSSSLDEICLERHGKSFKEIQKEAISEKLKEYNWLHTEECENKKKNTFRQRYNVDNYFQSEQAQKEFRLIKEKKYEDPYYNNPEKSKQTCLERYGVEYSFQSENNKEKSKKTMLEEYGVEFFCLHEKCRNNIKNSRHSKPNKEFEELLIKYKVKYFTEKKLKNYFYDFYLPDYNLLIDINPTVTHNITYSPFGKPTDKKYHQKRLDLALANNFKLIAIWDWMNPEKVIKSILNNSLLIKTIKNPKHLWVNYRTNEVFHSKKEGKYIVEIFTDKQEVLYE